MQVRYFHSRMLHQDNNGCSVFFPTQQEILYVLMNTHDLPLKSSFPSLFFATPDDPFSQQSRHMMCVNCDRLEKII